MTQGWMVLAACLLVGWGPLRDGSDRVMVGDWAPADAFLVGHHSLWQTTTDRVVRELESSRVMVVSPENDMHESVWVQDYGQIVELIGGEVKTQPFRVVSIDQVTVRQAEARPRIVLRDARRPTVALPDGRYVNQDEVVLAIRNGTIVGYGTAR